MFKKSKARIAILSSMLSYPTVNQNDWISGMSSENARIGDLVSLSSAPDSKWYVSWVREIRKNNSWQEYLLESIDDGALCWWSNVGLNIYNRERILERPKWQWDDKQFAFSNRWFKACGRNASFIVLPILPLFNEDNSVVLDIRIRHNFSDFKYPKTFPSWNKMLMKEMEYYYRECVEKYNKYENKSYTTDL